MIQPFTYANNVIEGWEISLWIPDGFVYGCHLCWKVSSGLKLKIEFTCSCDWENFEEEFPVKQDIYDEKPVEHFYNVLFVLTDEDTCISKGYIQLYRDIPNLVSQENINGYIKLSRISCINLKILKPIDKFMDGLLYWHTFLKHSIVDGF